MATQANWLHRIPPLRAPKRPRRHHHHHSHHHDLGDSLDDGIAYAGSNTVWLVLAGSAGMWWMFEAVIWAGVWFYYGLLLAGREGCRWVWRHNPVGRAAGGVAERRSPSVPVDPYARPVDLADYSEQPIRRRSRP